MALPEAVHPDDAVVGLVVGTLVCGALLLASIPHRRSRARIRGQGTGSAYRNDAQAAAAGREAWWVAGAAGVALVAPVLAVGADVVADVEPAAALAALVAAAVAGTGWWFLTRQLSARWLAVVVGASALGVWAAVPDTEAAVTLLATWTPFALLAVWRDAPRLSSVPVVLWGLLAVAPAWAAAWGASAREAALPGGLACFGVALVIPATAAIGRRGVELRLVVPIHIVAVLVAARWAARADTVGTGVVRSVAVIAVVGVVTAVSGRRDEPAHPPPSAPGPRPR